jgi:hypothetical protein
MGIRGTVVGASERLEIRKLDAYDIWGFSFTLLAPSRKGKPMPREKKVNLELKYCAA